MAMSDQSSNKELSNGVKRLNVFLENMAEAPWMKML